MIGGEGHRLHVISRRAVVVHLLLISRDGWIPTGDFGGGGEGVCPLAITSFVDGLGEEVIEGGLELRQIDAILWALRPGHAWLDSGEIELEIDAVIDLTLARHAEHSLCLEVTFEGATLGLGATRGAEEGNGFGIHREDTHGGPIFRGHVGNGGAIREGKRLGSLAVELDKFSDHLCGAEHLRDP